MKKTTTKEVRPFDAELFDAAISLVRADPRNRVRTSEFGEHEWPAMWAVREACRVGRRADVFRALIAEERAQLEACDQSDGFDAQSRNELLAEVEKTLGRQDIEDYSPEKYRLFGMAEWHKEEYSAAAAELLRAAVFHALDADAGDGYLERAARLLVKGAYDVESMRFFTMESTAAHLRALPAAKAASERIVAALRPRKGRRHAA